MSYSKVWTQCFGAKSSQKFISKNKNNNKNKTHTHTHTKQNKKQTNITSKNKTWWGKAFNFCRLDVFLFVYCWCCCCFFFWKVKNARKFCTLTVHKKIIMKRIEYNFPTNRPNSFRNSTWRQHNHFIFRDHLQTLVWGPIAKRGPLKFSTLVREPWKKITRFPVKIKFTWFSMKLMQYFHDKKGGLKFFEV